MLLALILIKKMTITSFLAGLATGMACKRRCGAMCKKGNAADA